MVESDCRIYVGIDWATDTHQACGLDCARRVLAERSSAHASNAIAAFAQWLSVLAEDAPACVSFLRAMRLYDAGAGLQSGTG